MKRHRLAVAFVLGIAVCTAGPVSAAVVLITQSKANAGGVTLGDAPGFPVTISESGSYRLDSNLTLPPAANNKNGIDITDADVTIDFNGFRLHGKGRGYNGLTGLDTATIKNGLITGFTQSGILVQNLAAIENMQIVANGSGVVMAHAGRIRESTIFDNDGEGVTCLAGCSIEANVINNNGLSGVVLISGTVLGNTIVGNVGLGLKRVGIGGALGYGNNTLTDNNSGSGQVTSDPLIRQLHPNACEPAC